MPQRYRQEVEAVVASLLAHHEKEGLIYSGAATLFIATVVIFWVDGLLRFGLIGG